MINTADVKNKPQETIMYAGLYWQRGLLTYLFHKGVDYKTREI